MSLISRLDAQQKTLTLHMPRRFDFSTHPEFRAAYREVDRSYTVIVDLKDTEYMDSAALGMLLLLRDEFPSAAPVLRNCNDFVKQILHIARFEKRFDIV